MKLWLALALLINNAWAQTLCGPQEVVHFSCMVKHQKTASLCASSDKTQLQYRFGTKTKIELSYPTELKDSPKKFFYAQYSRFQTNYEKINFKNDGVEYELNDRYEGKRSYSLRIVLKDGKEVLLPCLKHMTSEMTPLKTIVSCDPDDALNMGQCK